MPVAVTSIDNFTVCDVEFNKVLSSIKKTIKVTSMDNVAVRDIEFNTVVSSI